MIIGGVKYVFFCGETLRMGSYLTRSALSSLADATRLQFYLTHGSEARKYAFTYYPEAARWNSNATTQEGETYYVYGYMTAQGEVSGTISTLSGNYAQGAVMTLSGLSPVSTADAGIIVGVKGGQEVSQLSDITEWSYEYKGEEEGNNSVNFLIDHLYAAVSLQLKVGEGYSQLRTIRLKEIRLRSSSDSHVNISITQQANEEPLYSYQTSGEPAPAATLFESTDGEELTTETAIEAEAYVLPNLSELTLVSTYDVYDKSGFCLRRNCTSENNIQSRVRMAHGTKTTLHLTVSPTYLYVLSEADLNNPGVNIE